MQAVHVSSITFIKSSASRVWIGFNRNPMIDISVESKSLNLFDLTG